jgi:hypothetical protein
VTPSHETDPGGGPIGDAEVPVADAIEQRRTVGEPVEEIGAQGAPPDEANPADWQEQLTIADTDPDWDAPGQ